MNHSNGCPIQPPRLAVWLLELFAAGDQAQPVLGDLLEEFSELASQRGSATARRWIWRQCVKSIPRLIGIQLRQAPWTNSAAVFAGLLLLWLANMPLIRQIPMPYGLNWPEPVRLTTLALIPVLPLADLLIPPMLIGWLFARLSGHSGMAVAVLLALAIVTLRTIALLLYGHVAEPPAVWSLFWLADPVGAVVSPVAILLGGVMGRRKATRAL